MSKAAYHQRGETLDYTNTGASAIEAGTILIIGKRIGVAATMIQPKALGSVDVVGVFNMPKTSTNAITMGTPESQKLLIMEKRALGRKNTFWQDTQWPMQLPETKKFL